MLKLYIGIRNDTILSPDSLFNNCYYHEKWLNSNIVKSAIEDIDQAKVISNKAIEDRFGEIISPTCLSSGTKLIACLEKSNRIMLLDSAGNNCAKYVDEIARYKDLDCDLTYPMQLDYNNIESKIILKRDKQFRKVFKDYLDNLMIKINSNKE